jgi:F420-dependent oxidoreductase-like protein
VTTVRLAYGFKAINPAHPNPPAYIELARVAERCGYESLWAAETQATDPFGLLAWVGAHTTTIGLGCGVAQVTARTAVAATSAAVTLDALSGGRFRLGLGVSGPRIVQGWHGLAYDKPLSYLREYLAVVRMALHGDPISHTGENFTLPLPSGVEDVEPLAFPTPPSQVPVYLAGLGPRAVALAGELAEGWIAIHCPPEYMARGRSWLEEGAARSGRSLDGFTTSVMVNCYVDDDEELARDLVRPTLAVFLGGMGSSRTNFYNRLATRLGFGTQAAAAAAAFLAGDMGAAITALDDDVVDAMTICGSPDRVRDKLAAYRKAGVDTVIIGLAAASRRAQIEQLELVSTLAAGIG